MADMIVTGVFAIAGVVIGAIVTALGFSASRIHKKDD